MIRITLIIASLLAITTAQAGNLVPRDESKPLRPRTTPLLYDGPPLLQIKEEGATQTNAPHRRCR